MYLMQSIISRVPKESPGALVFSFDMLLNIPLIAEWQIISCIRESLVNDTLLKSNQRHINYEYFVGRQVKHDQTIKENFAAKS